RLKNVADAILSDLPAYSIAAMVLAKSAGSGLSTMASISFLALPINWRMAGLKCSVLRSSNGTLSKGVPNGFNNGLFMYLIIWGCPLADNNVRMGEFTKNTPNGTTTGTP